MAAQLLLNKADTHGDMIAYIKDSERSAKTARS